ncbi:hypothetical protein D3C73_1435490 [compost metagenome]
MGQFALRQHHLAGKLHKRVAALLRAEFGQPLVRIVVHRRGFGLRFPPQRTAQRLGNGV